MNSYEEEYTEEFEDSFPEEFEEPSPAVDYSGFNSFLSVITFILLPPLWCLSVPAIIFSSEAKHFYDNRDYVLYERFSLKAKKFNVAAWAVFAILASSLILIYTVSRLSLI